MIDFQLLGRSAINFARCRSSLVDRLGAAPTALQGSYQLAQVYAWRDDADGAFEWLQRAFEHHDAGLSYLKYDPFLRKLRGDARYAALLKRMNLPAD